ARLNVMLDLLIGPPPGLHGTLMHREMCDPSEALPVIVDEFILPMFGEMRAIAARLAPGVERKALERCVYSVVGQALFYRFTMPVTLRLLGVPAYPRGLARELAAHITAFSLGGFERVAGSGGWSGARRAEEVARLAAAPAAEAAPAGPLTLTAALALAARGNRRIAEAEEQLEVARARVWETRGRLLPATTGSGRYTWYTDAQTTRVHLSPGLLPAGTSPPAVPVRPAGFGVLNR